MIKKLALTALLASSALYADITEGGYKSIHLDSEDLYDGLVLNMDSLGSYASIVWNF